MHAGFTDVAVTDVTEAWEEVTRARAAAFEASKDRLRRVTHGQEEVFLRLQVRPGSQVHFGLGRALVHRVWREADM